MTSKAVLFDIGGVVLTNGWDRHSRRAVVDAFELDWDEFRDRHDGVADSFETGQISCTEYLERTVFYRERSFTETAFIAAMEAQSEELPGTRDVILELQRNNVFLATLNNESRELNEHRIATFGLGSLFQVFLSSCYLGVKKPEAEIYAMALDIIQRPATSVVFVDDRPLNLECAHDKGMTGLLFTGADKLRTDLAGLGLL